MRSRRWIEAVLGLRSALLAAGFSRHHGQVGVILGGRKRQLRAGALVVLFLSLHAAVALAVVPCGTRDGALREPTANDALFVLEAAVGLPGRCGPCLCDVDSGGSITIRDAALVLQRATGAGPALDCPVCVCAARVRQPSGYVDEFATGDFNGDGLVELAAHDGGKYIGIWLARGRGVLEANTEEHYLGGWRSRVISADIDGDGSNDIVTNGERYYDLEVLHGNGDGTFRDAEPLLTVSAEDLMFTDLDADGAIDLVASDSDPVGIITRLGNGDGTFGPELVSPSVAPLRNVRIGDLDGDTISDLVGLGDYAPVAILMYGRGDGTFGPPRALAAGENPADVEIGDFDRDGRADIAIVDWHDTFVRAYYGSEAGGFDLPLQIPIGGGAAALATGDVDRDGGVDLLVAQHSNDIALLRGGETGLQRAELLGVPDGVRRIELADIDADADLDLIALGQGTLVMLGNGDGSFVIERGSRATEWTRQVMLGDVDGDDVDDLVTADAISLSAYQGDGSGDFGSRVLTPLSEEPRSAFAADLDADRFVDVVITTAAGASSADYALRHVSVLRGIGDGYFTAAEPVAGLVATDIAHGDIDEDGHVDLAALVVEPARLEIYAGDGVGGLASIGGFQVGRRTGTPFLLDADGDGHLDLITVDRERTEAFVWLGNGDATFGAPRAVAIDDDATEVVAADFDDDGFSDLAFLLWSTHSFSLRFGNGKGSFVERPGFPPVPCGALSNAAVADFDADGAPDIVYIAEPYNSYDVNVTILPGDGRGRFRAPCEFSGRSGPRSDGAIDFVVGDIDGSGRPDLLTGHYTANYNNVGFRPDPGHCLLR